MDRSLKIVSKNMRKVSRLFFDLAVEDRMHLGNENKKTFLFCIPLGFHYLCHQKCKKTVN